jgi:uncharacterized protein (UPF0333 family)
MPYTAIDEALHKMNRRRGQVSGLRYLLLLLACGCIVAGVAMALFQIRRIDSMNIQLDTIGEVTSVIYVYLMALMWGVGGLIGFVFLGWFAAVCHVEAANLDALITLERAKQRLPL